MFQTTSHQPVFLSASVGEDQETLSTLKWPDGPPLLQCFKIGFWLPLYLLQKEHERTIKSPAGSNTCQKLHITFHRNIAFPCRILRHWQQIYLFKSRHQSGHKSLGEFPDKGSDQGEKKRKPKQTIVLHQVLQLLPVFLILGLPNVLRCVEWCWICEGKTKHRKKVTKQCLQRNMLVAMCKRMLKEMERNKLKSTDSWHMDLVSLRRFGSAQ